MLISDWSSDVCSSDLLPRLEHCEHHSVRLTLAEEAEASHHKHARHDLLLIVKSLHLAHRFFSPLTGRAGRRLYNGDDSALVLLRKEADRETREQDDRQADQRDEYCEPAQQSRQDPSDAALITVSRTSEPVVESSKEATGSTREPVLLALVFGYVRLEKSHERRGSESQRQQRQEHIGR